MIQPVEMQTALPITLHGKVSTMTTQVRRECSADSAARVGRSDTSRDAGGNRQDESRGEGAVIAGLAALFDAVFVPDPWVLGFVVRDRGTGAVVGQGGFKGPPRAGVVEIAYGTNPGHRGNGYATETAAALVDYAFTSPEVRIVIAHTLPDSTASQRVLEKCGFTHVGEEIDPEDGLVWRFEKRR
jgi:GNAT superfamily N-acetyltransferase